MVTGSLLSSSLKAALELGRWMVIQAHQRVKRSPEDFGTCWPILED